MLDRASLPVKDIAARPGFCYYSVMYTQVYMRT